MNWTLVSDREALLLNGVITVCSWQLNTRRRVIEMSALWSVLDLVTYSSGQLCTNIQTKPKKGPFNLQRYPTQSVPVLNLHVTYKFFFYLYTFFPFLRLKPSQSRGHVTHQTVIMYSSRERGRPFSWYYLYLAIIIPLGPTAHRSPPL